MLTKETQEKPKKSIFEQIKLCFKNITVEPIIMCYLLPSVMSTVATQNMNLEKSCRINLNFNKSICDALSHKNLSFAGYKTYERDVQTYVADFSTYRNILQGIFPALILLFLGSWSDRHKRRKPCILLPMIGEIIGCLGLLLSTFYFEELPLEFVIVAESLPNITGGWSSFFLGIFSYLCSIVPEDSRTLRIGIANLLVQIAICVGIAASGVLYENVSFYGVYLFNLVFVSCAVLYTIFLMDDVLKTDEDIALEIKNRKYKNCVLDFFDVRYVKELIKVIFNNGARNRRKRVMWSIILEMFVTGPNSAEMNLLYLFGQYKFAWKPTDYSLFSTFLVLTNLAGTGFALLLFTYYLKVHDAVLGMLSSISKILASLIFTFAPTSIYFFLGAIAECLNGTAVIATRSIVSKLVPIDELGKINSVFGICEAIIPLICGPLYNTVYSLTIEVLPGAFFLVGGLLTIPALLIFIWLHIEYRKDQKFQASKNSNIINTLVCHL